MLYLHFSLIPDCLDKCYKTEIVNYKKEPEKGKKNKITHSTEASNFLDCLDKWLGGKWSTRQFESKTF